MAAPANKDLFKIQNEQNDSEWCANVELHCISHTVCVLEVQLIFERLIEQRILVRAIIVAIKLSENKRAVVENEHAALNTVHTVQQYSVQSEETENEQSDEFTLFRHGIVCAHVPFSTYIYIF